MRIRCFTNFRIHKYPQVSKCGVFSGPYFLVFGLNTEIYSVYMRIQSISFNKYSDVSPAFTCARAIGNL